MSMAPVASISDKLAKSLNIADGSTAFIKLATPEEIASLPVATSITVEPLSTDYWEILESEAGQVEAQFLNQVALVSPATVIPFWLHGRTLIQIKIVDSNPKFPAMKLIAGSEIYISPKPRAKIVENPPPEAEKKAPPYQEPPPRKRALCRIAALGATFNPHVESFPQPDFCVVTEEDEDAEEADSMLQQSAPKGTRKRDSPKLMEKGVLGHAILPSEIWMSETDLRALRWKSDDVVSLSRRFDALPEPKEADSRAKPASAPRLTSTFAQVAVKPSVDLPQGHIVISESLAAELNLSVCDPVVVEFISSARAPAVDSILFAPLPLAPPSSATSSSLSAINPIDNDFSASFLSWLRRNALTHSSSSNSQSRDQVVVLVRFGQIIKLDSKYYRILVNVKDAPSASKLPSKTNAEFLTETSRKLAPLDNILGGGGLMQTTADLGQVLSNIQAAQPSDDSKFEESILKGIKSATLFRLSKPLTEVPKSIRGILARPLPNSFLTPSFDNSDLKNPFTFDDGLNVSLPRRLLSSVPDLGGVDTVVNGILGALTPIFASPNLLTSQRRPLSASSVLLTGPHGSGKTLVAVAAAVSLSEASRLPLHISLLSCSELAGLRSRQVRQRVANLLEVAQQRQPSLVIIDDLDTVAPHVDPHAPSQQQDQAQAPIIAETVRFKFH